MQLDDEENERQIMALAASYPYFPTFLLLPPFPFPFFPPRPLMPRTMTSPTNFFFVYALACSSSTNSSTNVLLRAIVGAAVDEDCVDAITCPNCKWHVVR